MHQDLKVSTTWGSVTNNGALLQRSRLKFLGLQKIITRHGGHPEQVILRRKYSKLQSLC